MRRARQEPLLERAHAATGHAPHQAGTALGGHVIELDVLRTIHHGDRLREIAHEIHKRGMFDLTHVE